MGNFDLAGGPWNNAGNSPSSQTGQQLHQSTIHIELHCIDV
jgi:hypothetical protein